MGLFRLFQRIAEKSKNETNEGSTDMYLENSLQKIKDENRQWELERNEIFAYRNAAIAEDNAGNNKAAIDMYLQSIEDCEDSKFNNKESSIAYAISRVIALYNKEKEESKLVDYLKYIIDKYPNYQDRNKWKVRLSKIENRDREVAQNINPEKIIAIDRDSVKKSIGARIAEIKKSFPEFNWYFDKPDDMDTFMYLSIHRPNTLIQSSPFYKEWGKLEDTFVKLSQKANLAEGNKDYKTAINNYLRMVVEECESTIPYERLMIIYRKLKWKEQETEIIKQSIAFFTDLKNKQSEYILYLGKKYGMDHKAQSYIDENKKVFYYGGAFELYNPQPKIEKWKERLSKFEI
ncbi:hypothetical protein SDC9_114362 [bioreactor metagenome]|uniref:Tetratricopeptide repeat protein n=1 Tax=bioreactor metagenome TaxID=1076179 RepID=A0A645BPR8_9ZZZZ